MGGEQAAIALERVLAGPPTARRAAAARAYAACADQMAQRGALAPRKRADAMYRQLLEEFDPDAAVRQAAYRGRVALASANAGSLIVEALRSDREELHEVALQAAHELPSDRLSVELAAMLPELSPSAKAGLVALLAERGGEAARAAIVKAADADDPALRVAALHALGQAGNAETVDLLVWKAAEAYKDEAEAARDSLARLRGEDVDHALLNQLEEGVWNECIQVIAAVEVRRNRTAVPRLVEAAEEHDHPEVRSAAYSAVGALAGPEAFASVVQALTAEPDADVRGEAVRAATRVAQGMPQDNRAAETVIDAMENASEEATASLVVLAGNLADPAALPKLYELAGSDSPKVRVAAIRALSDWPAPEPVERLLELASASEGQARALAMNGVLRLLALPSGRSADETLSLLERALAMAKTPAEKRRALQGLGQTRDPRAIEAIRPYLNNADLAEAAKEAMEALENAEVIATASHNPEAAHLALDGNPDTRWATGTAQEPGMWFQLDLGAGKTVTKLVLDASGSPGDYPRGYEVYASNDPTDFGEPIATGQGESAVVEIVLPETSQRLLRIVQTGSSGGLWWSIHEVRFD
jgi:HEAT repeat protein